MQDPNTIILHLTVIRGLAVLLVVLFHNFGYAHYFLFWMARCGFVFCFIGILDNRNFIKYCRSKKILYEFLFKKSVKNFPSLLPGPYNFLINLTQSTFLQDNLHYYVENQVWLWTYLQNWLFITKEPESTNFLVHLWSLAVEEQFYLLWPCIILWIRKPKTL
jgi:peptidoglycan/LPS O-acetylase OafA/YrhL